MHPKSAYNKLPTLNLLAYFVKKKLQTKNFSCYLEASKMMFGLRIPRFEPRLLFLISQENNLASQLFVETRDANFDTFRVRSQTNIQVPSLTGAYALRPLHFKLQSLAQKHACQCILPKITH